MASNTTQVARILYKEIVAGDLRKILATSNDAETGGGARDFRFGAYRKLMPIIRLMFPGSVKESRKRNGEVVEVDIFQGTFYWHDDNGRVVSKVSYFEPPTDVRPSEGRIARVHEYGCFDTKRIPQSGPGNRILLLLIQLVNGTVWPHYAEERTLRQDGLWDPVVAEALNACLDAERREGLAVIGYRDFTNMGTYCNGK